MSPTVQPSANLVAQHQGKSEVDDNINVVDGIYRRKIQGNAPAKVVIGLTIAGHEFYVYNQLKLQ